MAKAKQRSVKAGKQDVSKSSPSSSKKLAIFALGPILALLALVIPRPGELLPGFERVPGITEDSAEIQHQVYTRKNVYFSSGDSNNTIIAAWEYQPFDGFLQFAGKPPPIVIMAHGLGAQRDFGLHRTADVFARAGVAVLVFDYRTFGGSDGEPRHLANPYRHLEDWRAAIAYVRDKGRNHKWDASRLVLWGTSYGGGHVITLSAEMRDTVSGIIAMVPHLSGPAAAKVSIPRRGIFPSIRLMIAGVYDVLRSKLSLPPVYVRLAGPLGSMAVMALDEAELKSYFAKHPQVKLGGWNNMVQARFLREAGIYSPIDSISNITAPMLVIAALQDKLCPYPVIDQMARKLGIDVLAYPVDHFALYLEDVWAHSVTQMLQFVCEVTNSVCPKDKNAQYLELSTRIGSKDYSDGAATARDPTGRSAESDDEDAGEDAGDARPEDVASTGAEHDEADDGDAEDGADEA